ncbi:unnamed protein product, partial [Heterotrigona itama]
MGGKSEKDVVLFLVVIILVCSSVAFLLAIVHVPADTLLSSAINRLLNLGRSRDRE